VLGVVCAASANNYWQSGMICNHVSFDATLSICMLPPHSFTHVSFIRKKSAFDLAMTSMYDVKKILWHLPLAR